MKKIIARFLCALMMFTLICRCAPASLQVQAEETEDLFTISDIVWDSDNLTLTYHVSTENEAMLEKYNTDRIYVDYEFYDRNNRWIAEPGSFCFLGDNKAIFDGNTYSFVADNGNPYTSNLKDLRDLSGIEYSYVKIVVLDFDAEGWHSTTAYSDRKTWQVTGIAIGHDTISGNSISISGKKGDKVQLQAILIPEDADNQNVSWSSSDTELAAVDDKGLVQLKENGEAVVSVTSEDGPYTASCRLTIKDEETALVSDLRLFDMYYSDPRFVQPYLSFSVADNTKSYMVFLYKDGKLVYRGTPHEMTSGDNVGRGLPLDSYVAANGSGTYSFKVKIADAGTAWDVMADENEGIFSEMSDGKYWAVSDKALTAPVNAVWDYEKKIVTWDMAQDDSIGYISNISLGLFAEDGTYIDSNSISLVNKGTGENGIRETGNQISFNTANVSKYSNDQLSKTRVEFNLNSFNIAKYKGVSVTAETKKAEEQKDPEQTDSEQKDPEQTDSEQKDPEQTDPEQKDPEQTDPEQKDPEQTDPEQKNQEQTDPEQKDPEQKDPEQKDPEQKDPVTDGFADVKETAYYADAVSWAVSKGITTGTSATTFSPDEECSRGQIVTFLWRAAGSPEVEATNAFTDVVAGKYYVKPVAWAVANKITTGTSPTTFSPNASCTRAQAVTFMYRAAGEPDVELTTTFTDVPANAYYAKAVAWAVQKGITKGTSATTFSPNDVCKRSQIVTFLYRSENK